jgi:CrcB protein
VRDGWDARRAAAVGAGGAAGAALRWWIVSAAGVPAGALPWPILVANVAGSFVLGVVMAVEVTHPSARTLLHDGAGIGFCGGLTTFSTYAVDVVTLARTGRPAMAAVYAAVSVLVTVAALLAGAAVMRRAGALRQPLEAEP